MLPVIFKIIHWNYSLKLSDFSSLSFIKPKSSREKNRVVKVAKINRYIEIKQLKMLEIISVKRSFSKCILHLDRLVLSTVDNFFMSFIPADQKTRSSKFISNLRPMKLSNNKKIRYIELVFVIKLRFCLFILFCFTQHYHPHTF